MKLYMDVGGTHIRTQMYAGHTLIEEQSYASQSHDLLDLIVAYKKRFDALTYVGIAYAGQVREGVILSAPNIKIQRADIKNFCTEHLQLHVEIENDLNCAVMAEAHHAKSSSMVALYVGTGLGAACIDGGRLVRGWGNMALEIGHIPYKKAPFTCGCGKDNCLELFGSGGALLRWMAHEKLPNMTLEELSTSQNRQAARIAREFFDAIRYAMALLVTLANPKHMVLGGGLGRHVPLDDLSSWAFTPALQEVCISHSTLNNGALEGAKLLKESLYG